MTSFIIKSHVDRTQPPAWKHDNDNPTSCPFCRIIRNELPASRVFENEKVVAILDIMPLRKGHTLVIPKAHHSRLSELPAEYAAATGEAVSRVAFALTKALEHTALNVVCNQEYAQAVPHVHYHIIPAPVLGSPATPSPQPERAPMTVMQMHQMEFQSREELDDEEACDLAAKIRSRL
ncbi:HIT-like domain-containing protein [Infundibulicybe gibba]|nr:HIT-like domain-containing protein [Infundibulicybe gibba]